MKKLLVLIIFLLSQSIYYSQVVTTKVIDLKKKKISSKDDIQKDNIVSYEISLDQISVAEAGRNTIDNNDCRSTWGSIRIKFYELDANGQIDMSKSIPSDLNQDSFFE